MRKRILKVCGWLHKTILLASVIPAVYVMPQEVGEISFWLLFLKSLLIFAPVVITDAAIRRCRGLFSYFFVCVAVFFGTGMAAFGLGPYMTGNNLFWGYVILLLMETMGLFVGHFSDRMRQQEEFMSCLPGDREEITFAVFFRENQNFWDRPHLFLLCWFLAVYGMGILFVNQAICDQAVACTGIYVVLLAVATYLDKTERYLSLHRQVAGVPRSRIYGIGRGMFCVFLVLLLLGMLPGILLSKQRNYLDLRAWMAQRQTDGLVLEPEADDKHAERDGLDAAVLEELLGPAEDAPVWVEWIYHLLAVICVCFLLFLVYGGIRAVFAEFRSAYDDNGDLVETVPNESDDMFASLKKKRRQRRERQQGIRQKYRQVIRKHRKDVPKCWETPLEIEEYAGLAEEEAMQNLHAEYEKVRYGNRDIY